MVSLKDRQGLFSINISNRVKNSRHRWYERNKDKFNAKRNAKRKASRVIKEGANQNSSIPVATSSPYFDVTNYFMPQMRAEYLCQAWRAKVDEIESLMILRKN